MTFKKPMVTYRTFCVDVVELVDQDYATLQNETMGAAFCSGGRWMPEC